MSSGPNPVPTKRRQATEEKLLDALETVLVRDGLRGLSLNSVVEEAGVGKPLLYRYFNNLSGLLSAWAERRGSLSADHLGGSVERSGRDDQAFIEQVANGLIDSADALRAQPIMLELLAEELTANSEISESFAKARRRQSETFLKAMLTDERYVEARIRGKIVVLYAAINYLAMRSRRSPNFMGLRLDTKEGWEEAMTMVRMLVLA
jgi:AcrR family transcriptional regulator